MKSKLWAAGLFKKPGAGLQILKVISDVTRSNSMYQSGERSKLRVTRVNIDAYRALWYLMDLFVVAVQNFFWVRRCNLPHGGEIHLWQDPPMGMATDNHTGPIEVATEWYKYIQIPYDARKWDFFGPQHSKDTQKRSSTLFEMAFWDKSKQLCAFSSREDWVWSKWSRRAWTCWWHDWEACLKKEWNSIEFQDSRESALKYLNLDASWSIKFRWNFIDDATIHWSSNSRPGPSELLGTGPSARGETRPAMVWTPSDSFSQRCSKIVVKRGENIIYILYI